MPLSIDELLAGSALNHDVQIPRDLLSPNGAAAAPVSDSKVVLRPLNVLDLQRIATAAREDESLSAALMIQQSLVTPSIEIEQILKLPAGIARFLIEKINEISGISTPRGALQEHVQAPLAKACFVLAREFGWTPEQVSGMTIGQILLYLEMNHANGDGK
jgi:hypothetical protein